MNIRKLFIFFISIIFLNDILFCNASINKNDNYSISRNIKKIIYKNNNVIDIGELSILLSKEIYPDIDVLKYKAIINKMVVDIKKDINRENDPYYKIRVINDYLFKINGFKYDFNDMEAKVVKNQFLTGYLDTKEGSCITMPLLYYIICRRLMLPIYWVKVPSHFFCRYKLDDGTYINIEATSGGKIAQDSSYIKDFNISNKEIEKGVYLRSQTSIECAADILCIAGAYYARENEMNTAIGYFNESLKLNQKNLFAYKFLSFIYRDINNEEKADEYLQKAIELGYEK